GSGGSPAGNASGGAGLQAAAAQRRGGRQTSGRFQPGFNSVFGQSGNSVSMIMESFVRIRSQSLHVNGEQLGRPAPDRVKGDIPAPAPAAGMEPGQVTGPWARRSSEPGSPGPSGWRRSPRPVLGRRAAGRRRVSPP